MNITTKTICPKCDGSGKLNHFRHVANGECFKCFGTGRVMVSFDACAVDNGLCIEPITADNMFDFFFTAVNAPVCPA